MKNARKATIAGVGAALALSLTLATALPAQAADATYYSRSCGAQWAGTHLAGSGSHNHTATSGTYREYTYPSQGGQTYFQTKWGGGFHSVTKQTVTAGGVYSFSYDYCAG